MGGRNARQAKIVEEERRKNKTNSLIDCAEAPNMKLGHKVMGCLIIFMLGFLEG